MSVRRGKPCGSKIMPDAVESVQEIVGCGPVGNLETARSVHRFELVFKGGV